ncbi:HNH endonuclease [Glutamicibacter sp. V16R2B1]|nr:HNH endonuclease [Glutamicibacter sp. V16R2B1]
MSRHRRSTACWVRLLDQVGGMCVYGCGRPADHLDHILPYSQGGSGALVNRAPICRPCGESKGDMTVWEWVLVRAAELAAGCEPAGRVSE